ncbi:MAG: hypothetical protein JST00_08895 [Deltaproteobacteria bacterium]|nr:hypothetical protein [Deltaproteobacteria bacterium]
MKKILPAAAFVVLGLVTAACDGWSRGDGYYDDYTYPGRSGYDGGTSGSVASPTSCLDPRGFGGRGCWRCDATTSEQLLNACTTSHFETFDNGLRIAGFVPGAPRPPASAGPSLPPFEGGSSGEPDPNAPPPPACPLATKANPVMVHGATGFPMETIAKAMGTHATIFFQEKGSCEGVASVVLGQRMSGEVVYYDTDGTKNRCVLAEEHPVDIGLSALFASTCKNQAGLAEPLTLPADIADFQGPVSPVMFAVPATSKERAISADAAYRVFGLGSDSRVAPWTDESFVFRRRASSGNQQTVALTLGLDPSALRGRDSNGSSNMLQALLTSSAPAKTIGISSSEIVDTNRDVMKALAYRHDGQPVAFYPDSEPGSFDRRNVRDGHYFMWMPLHVLVRTAAGEPIAPVNATLEALGDGGTAKATRDAAVKRLVYVMTSRQQAPVPSVDLFGALKRIGTVPQCAMKVKRAMEGAPLEPFTPSAGCGCAFEAASPGAAGPDCTPCKTSNDCAGEVTRTTCSFGYCE